MDKVNGLTLKQWIKKVDDLFYDKLGLGVYDILGDFSSYSMWEEEITPEEAFEELSEPYLDYL